MQKFLWSLFGVYIALVLIREVFWFVRDNFTAIASVLGVIVLGLSYLSNQRSKALEEKRKEDVGFLRKIEKTTRSDSFRGYRIISDFGWINVSDCETTKEVEESLKIEAAKKGANAVIKMHWRMRRERYVAGHGKKGNPHYKNRTLYDGEGVAVNIEKFNKRSIKTAPKAPNALDRSDKSKPTLAGYSSGWIGIDGNNVFGKIFDQTNDAELSFQIMRKYLLKLKNSPYRYQVFWDGKFTKFAHALKIEPLNAKLEDVLTHNLSISRAELTTSELGQRVDDLIVPWAHIKTCAIISNDNYSKDYEDELIVQKSNQLKDLGLVLKFEVIAGEIVVPELTGI